MSDDRRTTYAYAAGLIVGVFLKAWLLMLTLGALHHEVSADIPAASYGGSLLLLIAASFLIGGVQATRSK